MKNDPKYLARIFPDTIKISINLDVTLEVETIPDLLYHRPNIN